MDPSLISFAIKGAFRLGQAGKVAFEQHARNKAILLPDTLGMDQTDRQEIIGLVLDNRDELLKEGSPYREYWNFDDQFGPKFDASGSDKASIAGLRAGLIRIGALKAASEAGIPAEEAEYFAGAVMVEQWRKGDGPPEAWAHIAVSVVDLALDFIAAKPELLGVDGNAARIVGSIADSLSDIIPDGTTEFDLKSLYGERLIAAFLKGALQGASDNAGTIFREQHLQELTTKTLAPVIAEIDNIKVKTNAEQIEWLKVVEALTGPAAQAAVGVLADHPKAFLGSDFDPETATGALTQAMLKEAASKKIGQNFSETGLLALFKAAVGVAAARPELILGKAQGNLDRFKIDVFRRVMETLSAADNPFSDDVVLGIATATLDGFKDNAVMLLDVDDDWDEVVAAGVSHVVEGFKAGIRSDGKGFEELYNREKLTELGRVLVTQIAKTPNMVVGTERDAQGNEKKTWRKELKVVTATVAKAMAADDKLLLTADDWVVIAEVAARQAAANPGPLFGLNESDIPGAVASGAITTVLTVAAEGFDGTRKHGDVAFGAALRDAIVATIEQLPKNLTVMAKGEGRKQLGALVKWTKQYVADHKDEIGSDDWLRLYKALLLKLLASGTGGPNGTFTPPTPDEIKRILTEA